MKKTQNIIIDLARALAADSVSNESFVFLEEAKEDLFVSRSLFEVEERDKKPMVQRTAALCTAASGKKIQRRKNLEGALNGALIERKQEQTK